MTTETKSPQQWPLFQKIKEQLLKAKHWLTHRSVAVDTTIVILGMIGYVFRGFIWAMIGTVAIIAAFKITRETADISKALSLLADDTEAFFVYVITTICIFCYSFWRAFEGFSGFRLNPTQKKFFRYFAGYVVPLFSALAYFLVGVNNIIVMIDGRHSDPKLLSWINYLSKVTWGRVLYTILSLLFVIVGILWLVNIFRKTYKNELDMERIKKLPKAFQKFLFSLAYIGTFGRAFFIWLFAFALMHGCWGEMDDDDDEIVGINSGLEELRENVTARVFLGLIGVMIFIFGIWSVLQAPFKHFIPYLHHPVKTASKKVAKKIKQHHHHTPTAAGAMRFDPPATPPIDETRIDMPSDGGPPPRTDSDSVPQGDSVENTPGSDIRNNPPA